VSVHKLTEKNEVKQKTKNPRVFFSYAWSNVWRANQLKNQTNLSQNKKAKFVNKSLKEKSKATNEQYIKRKIRDGINRAGTVTLVNSPGFEQGKYTKYEMEYAIKQKKKMIVVNTHKMKDKNGKSCIKTPKPKLCKIYHIPARTYKPRETNLKKYILEAKKPSKKKRTSQSTKKRSIKPRKIRTKSKVRKK